MLSALRRLFKPQQQQKHRQASQLEEEPGDGDLQQQQDEGETAALPSTGTSQQPHVKQGLHSYKTKSSNQKQKQKPSILGKNSRQALAADEAAAKVPLTTGGGDDAGADGNSDANTGATDRGDKNSSSSCESNISGTTNSNSSSSGGAESATTSSSGSSNSHGVGSGCRSSGCTGYRPGSALKAVDQHGDGQQLARSAKRKQRGGITGHNDQPLRSSQPLPLSTADQLQPTMMHYTQKSQHPAGIDAEDGLEDNPAVEDNIDEVDADEDFTEEDYEDDLAEERLLDEAPVVFIAKAPPVQQLHHYQPSQQHPTRKQTATALLQDPPESVDPKATTASQLFQHNKQQQQQQKEEKDQQQHHTSLPQRSQKTEVDQLLTAPACQAQQRRDSVRGNLEELRIAESVNYRPVMYIYSFRVADSPANMRVFTDPDDRRIEAIARSCDSQIHLERLPATPGRGIGGSSARHWRRVTIQSADLHSLEKCCRQFDDRFPQFYASGGLGQGRKSIKRVYADRLDQIE